MLEIPILNMEGKEVGKVELSEKVFGIDPNRSVMHQMVVNHLANKRQGTQSALTRSEVSGGGRKPWRQKGTGHARQGSTRAPQWRHGGVVFAPKPRTYGFSINKKVRKLGMLSAFSSKAVSEEIVVIDKIELEGFKTKSIVKMLSAIGVDRKALIVIPEADRKIINSSRNIKGVKTSLVNTLNVYDILLHDKLILVKSALEKIEEAYK